eukprot:6045588-Amphidinium_carterae.1
MEENKKLEKNLREEYDQHYGAFEDRDDYKKALAEKNSDAIKDIIFEYAEKIRERKLQWRDYK